jgi:hypothetical protein
MTPLEHDQYRRAGAPDWIGSSLLRELNSRLWHATDEQGWRGIVAAQAILPNAPAKYPSGFCRSIGGVSLFDLGQPDDAASPAASHWSDWLGRTDDNLRVWFEIDRDATRNAVLSPSATLARWRGALDAHSTSLRIIAGLEAAHLGPIPVERTIRVLQLRRGRLDRVR